MDYDPSENDGSVWIDPLKSAGYVPFVEINDEEDDMPELDETFTAEIHSGTSILNRKQTVLIHSNGHQPLLSIHGVRIDEGDEGDRHEAIFVVSLSERANEEVFFDFKTVGHTAVAGVDYVGVEGMARIAEGDFRKEFRVELIGDDLSEPDEDFRLELSNIVGAAGTHTNGWASIIDDDDALYVSITGSLSESVTIDPEGDHHVHDVSEAEFTVHLSQPLPVEFTAAYDSFGFDAGEDEDFVDDDGFVRIPVGETEKLVRIKVKPDHTLEADESFGVNLSEQTHGIFATPLSAFSIGKIIDDDGPRFRIDDTIIVEGDDGTKLATFKITKTGTTNVPTVVVYTTAGVTAVEHVDFTPSGGAVEFQPNEFIKTVTVPIHGDTRPEGNETVEVTITGEIAEPGDDRALITIVDNEYPPRGSPCAKPQVPVNGEPGVRLSLDVTYYKGRMHLPIVSLKKAA